MWKSSLLDLYHQHLLNQGIGEENIIHMNLESLRYRNLNDYIALYNYVSNKISPNAKTYLQFGGMSILKDYGFNEIRSNQSLEGINFTVVLKDILARNSGSD